MRRFRSFASFKFLMNGFFMAEESGYVEYARLAVEEFDSSSEERRNMLVDAIDDFEVKKVLDVGCGAGQQLLPFAERKGSLCVGVDIGEEVGSVGYSLFQRSGLEGKGVFLRALGEDLPFSDASFDVVICRVALPYMDNRKTIAEIGRVLRDGGRFFLKIHAPAFYVWMLKKRLPMFSLKQIAYPIICLTNGCLHSMLGKQPRGAFWRGKEVYQTKRFLIKELVKNNMRIVRNLADTNIASPSFLIEKVISKTNPSG